MRKFTSTHHMHHSAREMFDIVADIEAYPGFLPFCDNLTLRARGRAMTPFMSSNGLAKKAAGKFGDPAFKPRLN